MNNLYLALRDKAEEMCNGSLERESDVMFRCYAEMIVQECLDAISDEITEWGHTNRCGLIIAAAVIKQHFGLED